MAMSRPTRSTSRANAHGLFASPPHSRTKRAGRRFETTTPERDGINRALAVWRGGWRCDVQAGSFELVVDEPPSAGGTGLGPMPTDLLLASLSSCYALALAWAARKRGFELPDLEVTATGTYRGRGSRRSSSP